MRLLLPLLLVAVSGRAEGQSRYSPPASQPARTVPPSDFVAAYENGAAAHAALSPRMGEVLIAYYRHKLMQELPDVEGFLRLCVEYGDPLCDYVLMNRKLFVGDHARWIVFAENPGRYLPGAMKPRLPAATTPTGNGTAAKVVVHSPVSEEGSQGGLAMFRSIPWWAWLLGMFAVWLVVTRFRAKPRV